MMSRKAPFRKGVPFGNVGAACDNGSGPEVRQHLSPGLTPHHSTRPRSKG